MVVVIGLIVKDTRILVVGPPKSWLRVPQKVMPRNPDKLAHAKTGPNSLGAGTSHRAMWWPCGWLGAWTSYDLPTLRLPGSSLH